MDLNSFVGEASATVVGGVVVTEFNAEAPKLALRLTKLAVSISPTAQRERLKEEWCAYLDEIPGNLRKLNASVGFISTAFRLTYVSALISLAKLVVFVCRNPRATFYVVKLFRNYPATARRLRQIGQDIPWCPFELKFNDFCRHYVSRKDLGGIHLEMALVYEWLKSNPGFCLAAIHFATGIPCHKLFSIKVHKWPLIPTERGKH